MMTTTINLSSAFEQRPALKERFDAIKHFCNMLAADVWSGPFYITPNVEDAEDILVFKNKIAYITGWTTGIELTTTLFGSDFAKAVISEVEDIVSELPCFYDPEWDGWMDSEPGGYHDEGGDWVEPMPYYEVTRNDWYAFIFGERVYRDVMGI